MHDERAPRPFRELVWVLVRAIPRGRVMTYGQVARCLGMARGAQAVGNEMYHTPAEAGVPCQRVVNRYGGLAAAYGWGGYARHRADLEADGVAVREDHTVDLEALRWHPPHELIEDLALEYGRRLHEREGAIGRVSTEGG